MSRKVQLCEGFVVQNWYEHVAKHASAPPPPFFLGINGLQGSGKTTLVEELAALLAKQHNLNTICLSIDDFYLPRSKQIEFASNHPNNRLVQTRGEPGTHDLPCATGVFTALKSGALTKLPRFDKSAFNGAGDRVKDEKLLSVNQGDSKPVDIILFEGWCIGFQPLEEEALSSTYRNMLAGKEKSHYESTKHPLESLLFVNEQLKGYQSLFNYLDALILLDSNQLNNVYEWRLEAEHRMKEVRGSAMTDEEVINFVNNYMPAYELYLEHLRAGTDSVRDKLKRKQLRIVIDKQREVVHVDSSQAT